MDSGQPFEREKHVTYLQMMYQILPHQYQTQEINRLTLAYFVVSGLDLLRSLDCIDKNAVADWVLSLQARPRDCDEVNNGQFYGFCGSRSSQFNPDDNNVTLNSSICNLASTYSALAILKIIGYDLSNIKSEWLLKSMRNLQQPDGSFMPIHTGAETDLRFIYCAAAICHMLGNWSGMDKEKAKEYIINCQSYDGGFGLTPGAESHGGAIYCGITSLRLMGFLEEDLLSKNISSSIINVPMLLVWCLQRQAADGGFQGRPNKPSDTCYAFWIASILKILGGHKLIDQKALRGFLITCQSEYGGFSKFPGELPDLYHSYYGFTAFSLLEEPGLSSLCVELGMTDLAAIGI
ncbi:PREDICTED: geranylgeranyl transferase type-1 subunit beta [Fragaria vesca subsp. vesca]|uniref:geranylgeranyl transferase type-1 subunit beta n=1 Tax=Fragaria vesca subsp. vesca TaxID=101020 RepID=UPI0002C30699|nr:PREDICTED: geranylgeranyl transferase type-1 subunit beta [Fragaria vesca subsp. vesca]